ncbi:MAG: rhomboid family intramembrane serine protease [Candidatus Obscuribacterales bacterium]|nr:rhomboid family intramembrane serine protease [Candidatus Obscuribacterales bacterium]
MFPVYDDNQSSSKPIVTWVLIVINVFVFVNEVTMPEGALNSFLDVWGTVPSKLTHSPGTGEYLTLFTSMFLHGGWSHLIGNMWFLHIFGDNVEDRMGHFKYLLFYLICGIAASLAQVYSDINTTIPGIGASGAISGVLGAYLILFPGARVRTYIGTYTSIWVPAVFFIVIWFMMQFLPALASMNLAGAKTGGIAFWAHVGGFIAGVVLVKLFASGSRESQATLRHF